MNNSLTEEFIQQSVFRIDENLPRIKKCLALLSEEDVWFQPNKATNSIANLILHLCGNIRQYAISSLSNTTDTRERDLEFSTKEGLTKDELIAKLFSTVEEAKKIMAGLNKEELLKSRSVQGFNFTGIGIIIHVTEHYSYHTGQIAFITKLIKNKDLGFYAGINLNTKNKTL